MAGHGTFIAGVVRQHCADARIVAVPVMYGDGAADEGDLIDALQRLLVWHWVRLDGKEEGEPLSVVSLSLGYYHETPGAVEDEAGLFGVLRLLQAAHVTIVAAAGNGATTTPFWPAALAARHPGTGHARLVSVGAWNPTERTVALFSNTGPWVSTYRCGVAVVSTMPTTFDGSLRGAVHVPAGDLPARGTPDPDDYACGFGVWNGSSFSAPAFAGQLAHALRDTDPCEDSDARDEQVGKAVAAVLGDEP